MPQRFEAFHRPFALSGGLMRVLGAVVQIPRPPVLHRRHELAVGDLVAAQGIVKLFENACGSVDVSGLYAERSG